MGTEIEAKLKVESLTEVEQRLQAVGAEFVAEQNQSDAYYDDPVRALAGGDRCLRVRLRVRRQQTADRQEVVLTYKGPKQRDDFKKRLELEVLVSDGETLEQILTELGYQRTITVKKRRRLWRQGDCLVALDDVAGLGQFVEIEGPDDRAIKAVQKGLGLDGVMHIRKGYAHLLAARREKGE